jgi:hypothetical protein
MNSSTDPGVLEGWDEHYGWLTLRKKNNMTPDFKGQIWGVAHQDLSLSTHIGM